MLSLSALNIVRLVTLFLAGVYLPSIFEFLHTDFWQACFVFMPLALWLAWVRWVMGRGERVVAGSG
jgi:exosortase/archaeosortase family protein